MATVTLTSGSDSLTIPAGTTSVGVSLYGAAGQSGGASGGAGGKVTFDLAVVADDVLTIGKQPGGAGSTNGGADAACNGGDSCILKLNGSNIAYVGGGGGAGTKGIWSDGTTPSTPGPGGHGGGTNGQNGTAGGGGAYGGGDGQGGQGATGGSGGFTGGSKTGQDGYAAGSGSPGIGGAGGDFTDPVGPQYTGGGGGGGGGYAGGGGGGRGDISGDLVVYGGGGGGGGGSSHVVTGTSVVHTQGGNVTTTPTVAHAVLVYNQVPNAPSLGFPSGGQTIDRANTLRLSWTFSDPDAGDTQSKYDLRYRVGVGAWTDTTSTTPNQFRDFTGGTFTANDFEWQVRTYDALGVVGAYSASGFFTAADAPAGPSITAPINGGTIDTNPYTVTWSAAEQDAYQLRTVADLVGSPDTGTVYTDTGTVESAVARAASVAFGTNGRDEHIQLRVRFDGIWSSWASNLASVDYTVPAVPTVALTADDTAAAILVEITNPAPTGSEPVVTEHRVWRREGDSGAGIRVAVGLAAGLDFTDRTPASGVNYSYRVESVGANQTVSTSAWTTTAASGSISGDVLDGGEPDTTFTSEADGGGP